METPPPNKSNTTTQSSYTENTLLMPRSNEDPPESSCCKTYRFEFIMLPLLLVLLAVPIYFMLNVANRSFEFHRECVACFREQHGVAFNPASQICMHSGDTHDTSLVWSLDFCGAPQCQVMQTMPGVRPVPYWSMIASSVLATVLAILVNLLKVKGKRKR